jgi:hypothetical protein
VLRSDFPEDNKLIVGKTHTARTIDVRPGTYPNLHRIVGNNIIYIANLMALEQWYLHVRRPFLEVREFGGLIFSGLMDTLALAKKERFKRLRALSEKARRPEHGAESRKDGDGRNEFCERFAEIEAVLHIRARGTTRGAAPMPFSPGGQPRMPRGLLRGHTVFDADSAKARMAAVGLVSSAEGRGTPAVLKMFGK